MGVATGLNPRGRRSGREPKRFQCGPPPTWFPSAPDALRGLVSRMDNRGRVGEGTARILLRLSLLVKMALWASVIARTLEAKWRYIREFRSHISAPAGGRNSSWTLEGRARLLPLSGFMGVPSG